MYQAKYLCDRGNAHQKGSNIIGLVTESGRMMQTSLHVLAEAAKRDKTKRFKSLYSFLNRVTLNEAYQNLNKKSASGVDGVTYQEYGRNLEQNLINLETKLKNKRYFAQSVRRVMIPKGNGKERPLGIPVLEDKLVQYVVRELLEALFEPLFYKHSYAYRPGRSAQEAVDALWNEINGQYRYVVEVDIKSFFDSIDHEKLIRMIEIRVADSSLTDLIGKWLKAGIQYDDGHVENPEEGTPQGGVISPILANIFLHYALDNWFQTDVKMKCTGRTTLIRYADDFVAAFQSEIDAEWFYSEVGKRLAEFGLELSEEKTRKIRFTRFDKDGSGTFDFLGFTFQWGTSRKGNDVVKTRTSTRKQYKAITAFVEWIKRNRHMHLSKVMSGIKSKLRGHRNYFGRSGNSSRIKQVYRAVEYGLFKWLNRRSQRKSYTWKTFDEMMKFYNVWSCAKLSNQGVQISFLSLLV
jgi:group II intron reverse transcriptase/maturase